MSVAVASAVTSRNKHDTEKGAQSSALFVCGVETMADYVMLESDGAPILGESGAMTVLEVAISSGTDIVVVPRARRHPDMLELSTRQLGLFLQKLVNYHRQVVILGDVSDLMAASKAFRDFVYESNKGNHVWFLSDQASLDEKLPRD